MSSRNLLNLVLFGIVLVLIVIVVVEPGKTPETTLTTLTTLKQDDISHILIQRDTGIDIELQKTGGKWQMLKPFLLPANDFRMQSLLRLLETESYSQNDLSKLDISKFSLDKPRAKITFNHQYTILFGGNEPLQQRRYVQADNTLHLILDTFYYQLAAHETTYLDHSLLGGKQNINRLELPALTVEFKEGKWHAMPKQENISADAVTDLINQWRNTQAIKMQPVNEVISKDIAKIFFKDQEQPIVFHIQKNKGETALIRKDIGLAYILSEDVLKKLLNLAISDNDKTNDADKTP